MPTRPHHDSAASATAAAPTRRPPARLRASQRLAGGLTAALLMAGLLAACGGGGDAAPPEPSAMNQSNAAPLAAQVAPPPAATDVIDLRSLPDAPLAFRRREVLTGMSYSYGFAVEDFDGDGRPDLSFFDSYNGSSASASRTDGGAIGYVQWNGGQLQKIVASDRFGDLTAPPTETTLLERHVTIDINRDGRRDIVGVANSHGAVIAYLNPGSRRLAWGRRVLTSNTPGAVNIASGDIDGDGDIDLVVSMRVQNSTDANPSARGLVWLENPGAAGGAWRQHAIEGSADLVDPRTLQLADITGDGHPEVVVADASTGVLSWYGRGPDGVWTRHDIPGVLAIHGHFGITLDIDHDGHIDILQPTYQGITLARNVDGGKTWEVTTIARFARETDQIIVSEVAVGDLDLDGSPDIVFGVSSLSFSLSAPRRGGIYWLRQRESTWDAYKIMQEPSSTVGIALVDFDGDGDLDIVSNSEYPRNAVTMWVNPAR